MEPPSGPFPVYRGSEPYVYVCHASVDAYLVFEVIRELHLAGFPLWYFEEGMKADPSWPDQNARAIDGCAVFLIFTSAISVSRPDTMDELTFAHNARKPVLQVQLEELTLPRGMALFLERPQAILAWRKDRDAVVEEAIAFLQAHGVQPIASQPLLPRGSVLLPSTEGMPPRSHGRKVVSISDTFANRVGESELLATAVERQLARLRGDETIEEGVFPHILAFHGRSGLGKTGLSQRLESWATGKPLADNEWDSWPHRPVTPVRWNFNDSAGDVRLDRLLVALREALARTGIVPLAFDLALSSYLEAVRPGSAERDLSLSGGAADGVLRSLQRIASELSWSPPGSLTATEVRRLRDCVVSADDRGSLARFEGLPSLLEQLRQLGPGDQGPELVAEIMYLLTQEIFYITTPDDRPALVFFLDTFERLQRHESRVAESAITAMIGAMPYGLFIITSQDALDWHETNRTYLEHCGPSAWPGLASGDGQHILDRLSMEDTRRLYTTHREINRWHISDELVEQLVKRSDGLPLHIEAVMQLARRLERQQPGRVFAAEDLDQDLPQVVNRLMATLSERERNAFRAACVLPFFDIKLAAAVMAEGGLDREGAVEGAIKHALVESNPGSLYPWRVHDEVREQVKRDRETPGYWGAGDWEAAAERGINEAKRRVDVAHQGSLDSAEIEALVLAIRIAYEWDVTNAGLEARLLDAPTVGGLSPLLPVPPATKENNDATALLRYIHAIALPFAAGADALKPIYESSAAVASYAGRWRAYRLRDIDRHSDALSQLKELDERYPGNDYNRYQYAITLRGYRRFEDGIQHVAKHTPNRMASYSRSIERLHGLFKTDSSPTQAHLATDKSKRFQAEREVADLLRRSRLEWVSPAEVQAYLDRAVNRRARGDHRTCLMVLGYTCLAQPTSFGALVANVNELMRSYDSTASTVAHLLALRALLTGSNADAKAAHDAVNTDAFRGAAWISVEVWLEELGYPLPPVPTQWTIPYEDVRKNWLEIAYGIIERAKTHAPDDLPQGMESLTATHRPFLV
ncbi:MAG: toll/interleukin-1 receptor domain-containing protein [Propionibacteriaceae bacterium]|jgi:hypothetical protein|nr:toll/interleukin-1 receptor domain-containing protein [Propionibacteriaceae bacterium]